MKTYCHVFLRKLQKNIQIINIWVTQAIEFAGFGFNSVMIRRFQISLQKLKFRSFISWFIQGMSVALNFIMFLCMSYQLICLKRFEISSFILLESLPQLPTLIPLENIYIIIKSYIRFIPRKMNCRVSFIALFT